MKTVNRAVTLAVPVAMAFWGALGISGCFVDGSGPLAHIGETQTENISVPLGAAKSVHAHLEMAAGELDVSGGTSSASSQLLDGKISYNVPEWKPDLSYSVNDGQGSLMVMQPEHHHTTMGGAKYTWDLHFSNKVPLELAVEMGAGESKLDLADLELRNLDVQVGAGDSTIDLTGEWKQDVSVSIQGGVGEVHVKLPRDLGVRVTVEGGLGSVDAPDFKRDGSDYVNDAAGKTKNTIEVHISGGIGQVYLELGGGHDIV
ncbi:MAG: toast rack family protein [Candidatus Acidiferrales bacterium]